MNCRLRFLIILAAGVFAAGSFGIELNAQKRDRFSHATAAHKKKDCSSCHTMPTTNWVRARGFPDVAEFPGHAACVSCHGVRDFIGFCAACHSSVSPRRAPRYPFPVRTRSHEFSTIFPHDIHQDVIATNKRNPDVAVAHFVNASFVKPVDDKPQFNNCAICHATPEKLPKFGPRGLAGQPAVAGLIPDIFDPEKKVTPAFFKDSPTGHASCFTCHFQNSKPVATNCAACHRLEAPYSETGVIARYSIRFSHLSENHSNKDCATCHVRISQNADLRMMKDADVPILTCSTSSCHGAGANDAPKGDGKYLLSAIANETAAREEQPAFQCSFCHTSAIGRFPMPKSHQSR